ncbi:hypothetical protein JYG34_15815 [Pseudomonas entomophila]|uniref:hypothetical protein n=1 Tax=Pseudomonas entomophila TaxID=312306 RepID=UPI001BCBDB4F|nr:hypothetical protein [Pseudomonas entomophila]QVM89494.1 hypothetical protein JYG34_15815 [Pseudomonas entomophila]
MNTFSRRLSTALLVLGLAMLGGCANHPELRPYTAEEARQLQLEALQRQGLSQNEYEQRRLAILRAGQAERVSQTAVRHPSIRG